MNHETTIVTCMNVTIWEILGVDVTDNCKVVGQKLFYAFLSIHSSYRCAVKSAKGKICHSKIQTKRSFHSFVIDGVDWMCTLRVLNLIYIVASWKVSNTFSLLYNEYFEVCMHCSCRTQCYTKSSQS